MKVFVATYEHKHGRDISVYATYELAESARQGIAAEYWPHEFGDKAPPADPRDMANEYFDSLEGREWFDIEQCEVAGA